MLKKHNFQACEPHSSSVYAALQRAAIVYWFWWLQASISLLDISVHHAAPTVRKRVLYGSPGNPTLNDNHSSLRQTA